MTDPTALNRAHAAELLMRCEFIISCFRNRLSKAGYPFVEPPEAARIIAEIDACMAPVLAGADIKTEFHIPVFTARG